MIAEANERYSDDWFGYEVFSFSLASIFMQPSVDNC